MANVKDLSHQKWN